ncbi:hypothetical protein HanIR_Chr11g0536681 [Helianthus annuus]|nr:hypothetical protein HanIR_Chr11g0536681 [Helianthus annuus]
MLVRTLLDALNFFWLFEILLHHIDKSIIIFGRASRISDQKSSGLFQNEHTVFSSGCRRSSQLNLPEAASMYGVRSITGISISLIKVDLERTEEEVTDVGNLNT